MTAAITTVTGTTVISGYSFFSRHTKIVIAGLVPATHENSS